MNWITRGKLRLITFACKAQPHMKVSRNDEVVIDLKPEYQEMNAFL